MNDFIARQRVDQADYFARSKIAAGFGGSAWRLEGRGGNLVPDIREAAEAYFRDKRITWHRHANHGLSSQVCCLNFLMPLATRPDVLSQIIGHALGMEPPKMLPVESGPNGEDWYVGFEWTGKQDYLGEWPKGGTATRGANATSADAVVRFNGDAGVETLLIEWKFTEAYGAPLADRRSADGVSGGNLTRDARYAQKSFAPAGPIRADLGLELKDFFWEPFYQLLRQQILASAMQTAREDGADRVRVLHVSPAENGALHKVAAPALRRFGTDAFEAFSAVLVEPSTFIGRTIDQVFGAAIAALPKDDPWSTYLTDRYRILPAGPAE